MKTHELKTWPKTFQLMWDEKQLYDLRLNNDHQFEVGDKVRFLEWVPEHEGDCDWKSKTDPQQTEREDVFCTKCGRNIEAPMVGKFTDRAIVAEVTLITDDSPGLKPGVVVFAFKIQGKHKRTLSSSRQMLFEFKK
jgi:hypothetical protein